MRKLLITVTILLTLIASTAIAQSQRFNDVPPDHPAQAAIEWAADTGLSLGCGDGTNFCPDKPLSRWQAVTFMERYYDDILQATESDTFTRADMMTLLHTIDSGAVTAPTTTIPAESAWESFTTGDQTWGSGWGVHIIQGEILVLVRCTDQYHDDLGEYVQLMVNYWDTSTGSWAVASTFDWRMQDEYGTITGWLDYEDEVFNHFIEVLLTKDALLLTAYDHDGVSWANEGIPLDSEPARTINNCGR